ncbi:MAG: tetratricopeptide repeat-containing sulfotransferase family protein [Steroidobacteraceae bacterium]
MNMSPHPTIARGREALARGDLATARAAAEERLRSNTRDLHALELRFRCQHRSGELDQAIKTLGAVIAIDAHAAWAYDDLIHLLFTTGRRGDAEQVARTALRVNPRNAQTHHLFGTILSESNDLPAGEWHFRRALELGGREARYLANLALNLMQQGRTEEAEACYAEAVKLAPDDMKTLAHWSKLQEVRGDLKRAWELLAKAQAVSSESAVDLLRAGYLSREGRHAEALAIIDAAPTLGGHGQLERGRLCDRLGRYDEAWRDFVEGKRKLAAEAGGLAYQGDAVETFFGRLKRFFVRRNIELLPRTTARADTPQPIFVLGFPRSGTTMIEQALSSHPEVRAGGELSFIAELRQLANSLFPAPEPFPENLGRTWTADNRYAATLFRDYYLARAEGYGLTRPGKRFFIDKMPFNEVYLPLLRMAFPESRIVSIVRHPLDVCVSMMANNLTHGFNCGYRIDDVVRHFAAVFDLVEHYRCELTVGDFVLKYESFVANQDAETRRLLEYLGLPFDTACLDFHENRRYAPTPSYAQVTEPLHDRSIGRYRHYAAHLAPFAPRLAPMLAAYGYEQR